MNTLAPFSEAMMSWQKSVTVIYSIVSGKFKGGPSPRPGSCRRNGEKETEITLIVANIIDMTHFMYTEGQIRSHFICF